MRTLYFLIGSILLLGLAGCSPSESQARKVFSALIAKQYGTQNINVTSFVKTNGFDEVNYYRVAFTATVQFPKGANTDCAPMGNTGNVMTNLDTRPCRRNGDFVPVGAELRYQDMMNLMQSENGWVANGMHYFAGR